MLQNICTSSSRLYAASDGKIQKIQKYTNVDLRNSKNTEQGLNWSLISDRESLYGLLVSTRKAFAVYLRGYLQYLFSFFFVCVASTNLSVIFTVNDANVNDANVIDES